ncbi:uncharacterized protein EV422DRAFT_519821 [Fimicolochytrium jonesii]|uniref:uncharacterized protein n=1 Tax=Fimicolochytrium jonesii TaxID=1396493 RepID=UPI0022FEAC22|nr:uncharacterized protein EV422DRAFT_519821 [Fimicolochytrium jonesii]KAI8824344.1 hypothetical protein EV422DRAFT_519821 [Fimicolochytrium jonesii]
MSVMEVDSQPAQQRSAPVSSSLTNRKAILELLLVYFSDSEIKGTVANIPQGAFSAEDWVVGWIPITTLCSFKRLQSLTKDPLEVASVAHELAQGILEVSTDGSKLRRLRPFTAQDVANLSALAALSQNVVEVTGFARLTPASEVSAYFSRFGPVANVMTVPGQAEPVFHVEFQQAKDMVEALARQHSYEDATLHVVGRTKKTIAGAEESQKKGPSNKKASVLESHAGGDVPRRDRVLRFQLADGVTATGAEVKNAMSKFATVHSVELDKEATSGYIRLKKSVAVQLLPIIARQGGALVHGEPLKLGLLGDDEERLYWEVSKQKEKIATAEKKAAPPSVPVTTESKRKAGRQQRRSDRGPYSKGRKGNARNTPKEKVKINELETLFSSWAVTPETKAE